MMINSMFSLSSVFSLLVFTSAASACNVTKMQSCLAPVEALATDVTTLCPAIATFRTCVGDLLTTCQGDVNAETALASFASLDLLCGGAGGCNVTKLSTCFTPIQQIQASFPENGAPDIAQLCPAFVIFQTCAGDSLTTCATTAIAALITPLENLTSMCTDDCNIDIPRATTCFATLNAVGMTKDLICPAKAAFMQCLGIDEKTNPPVACMSEDDLLPIFTKLQAVGEICDDADSPTTAGGASPTAAGGASPTAAGGASPTTAGGASPTAAGGASPTAAGGASPTAAGGASPTTAGGASPTAAGGASPTAAGDASPTTAGGASPTTAGDGGQESNGGTFLQSSLTLVVVTIAAALV